MTQYRLSHHAKVKAANEGVPSAQLLEAADNPSLTYPNPRMPHQMRHVLDGVSVTVDPVNKVVVTFYAERVKQSV